MSILKHYNWEHEIVFEDGSITYLFIENPITLRDYVLELISQIEGAVGNFVLSENGTEISIPKNITIITDPINLKFDEKKINTRINKDIITIMKEPEIQKDLYPLISFIEQYANKIIDNYKLSINYEPPDDTSIVKMLNFHINIEYTSPADKLLEWMNITHDILGIDNFIIVGLNTYFSKEELEIITTEASSIKHNLFLINQYNNYECKNRIIIDNDNCELF